MKPSANGYVAQIGYSNIKRKGQPKFYLGHDKQQANIRRAYVEQVWNAAARMMKEQAFWPPDLLQIARAVSKGEQSIVLDFSFAPATSADLFAQMRDSYQQEFPFIKLELSQEVEAEATEYFKPKALAQLVKAKKELDHASRFGRIAGMKIVQGQDGLALLNAGKGTFFDAIDKYCEACRLENVKPGSKQITLYGAKKIERASSWKFDFENTDLILFGIDRCKQMFDYFRNRPTSRYSKKPISTESARNMLKEVRRFLRWLDMSPLGWRMPRGLESMRFKIARLPQDNVVEAVIKPIYTSSELGVIWKGATQMERLMIVLGLNCSFGAAEMGRLKIDNCYMHKKHPFADKIELESTKADCWIKTRRPKTNVFGEWWLWPQTIELVQWAIDRAKAIGTDILLTTDEGRPLYEDSSMTNPQVRFANKWLYLVKVKAKSESKLPVLPFGSLRDTLPTVIRHRYTGELASLQLAHGKPVKGDDLLRCYTENPYGRLHRALRELATEYRFTSCSQRSLDG